MRAKAMVCLSAAILLSVLLSGCSQGGGVSLPIKVENADHVGALALNLLYDSMVLEVTGVDAKALARTGTPRWTVLEPGKLLVVVENADIDGGGTLVEAKFKVVSSTGLSTLTIQVLEARSLNTGELVEAQVTDGAFTASDRSVEAPVISFGP